MKILVILLTTFIFIWPQCSYGQHFLLFEKYSNTYAQIYFETPTFPGDGIQTRYNEGFEIVSANFKQNRWFIAMRKNLIQSTQQTFHNPTKELLEGKLSDGYSIVDFCYYYSSYDYKINWFYVLNKTSTGPTNGWFTKTEVISSSISYVDYPIYLVGMIHTASANNLRIQTLRTYGHPAQPGLMLGYVFSKAVNNPPAWVWAARTEYPTDFINNKTAENYKLNSLVYSTYDKKWIVVMEENTGNIQWRLVNYNNKVELDKAFAENYTLVKVF